MANQAQFQAIRDTLSRMGKTQVQLALELGVSKQIVAGVLAGRIKGTRGDAHKVAVALGLKEGVIVGDETLISEAVRAAA